MAMTVEGQGREKLESKGVRTRSKVEMADERQGRRKGRRGQ